VRADSASIEGLKTEEAKNIPERKRDKIHRQREQQSQLVIDYLYHDIVKIKSIFKYINVMRVYNEPYLLGWLEATR